MRDERPVEFLCICEFDDRCELAFHWKQQLEREATTGGPAKRGRPADDEVARLRRDVVRLEEENAILKKAAIYFARESK